MKTSFISSILICSNILFAQGVDTTKLNQLRIQQNDAFTYGERLSFEISYGFLTAAEAFMNISSSPVTFFYGRDVYEINFDVNSRSSFDFIYKVRDNYKTFIDAKGIFPWKFEQQIREKDYARDFDINFDQLNLKVKTKLGAEEKEYGVPEYVQDIISAFYYARTLDWRGKNEGDIVTVQYFYKDGVYPLDITFRGREDVDVSAGEFRTFILEPKLKEGFTTKTSDITVWLTDDDRKIPVKVKMKIIIGSLIAELTGYEGLNGPLGAKK